MPPESNQNAFEDVAIANESFAQTFVDAGLTGWAKRGLAIVTCMDSRIDPLAVVGMSAGDVKILRNAGARVTDDVLRTLALAGYLLGVERVLVMPHTDCRMAKGDEESIHRAIDEKYGVDTTEMKFQIVQDQEATLRADVDLIREFPLLPQGVTVAGAIYDVHTGKLKFVC